MMLWGLLLLPQTLLTVVLWTCVWRLHSRGKLDVAGSLRQIPAHLLVHLRFVTRPLRRHWRKRCRKRKPTDPLSCITGDIEAPAHQE
jgi:hypothetical protein